MTLDTFKQSYSGDKLRDQYDNLVLDFIEDNWEEDGFDTEHEWYSEFNNGEAYDALIQSLESELKATLSPDIVQYIKDELMLN